MYIGGSKAEFARLAAIAKAKAECISAYSIGLQPTKVGQINWDEEDESCTRDVFAFEGIPVNSLEAVEKARLAKYGEACSDWRESKMKSKYISINGEPQTKDPECSGQQFWFHSGEVMYSQVEWTDYDNKVKEQQCIKDRSRALKNNKKGKYQYTPALGPEPCGKVVWLCEGSEYTTLSAYETTKCAKTVAKKKKKKKKKPAYCKNFKPHKNCGKNKIPMVPLKSSQCMCPYP